MFLNVPQLRFDAGGVSRQRPTSCSVSCMRRTCPRWSKAPSMDICRGVASCGAERRAVANRVDRCGILAPDGQLGQETALNCVLTVRLILLLMMCLILLLILYAVVPGSMLNTTSVPKLTHMKSSMTETFGTCTTKIAEFQFVVRPGCNRTIISLGITKNYFW